MVRRVPSCFSTRLCLCAARICWVFPGEISIIHCAQVQAVGENCQLLLCSEMPLSLKHNVPMSRKNCHKHDPAPLSLYNLHTTTSRYIC